MKKLETQDLKQWTCQIELGLKDSGLSSEYRNMVVKGQNAFHQPFSSR